MEESIRLHLLSQAEEIFDNDTLFKLANSVSDLRGRRSLRYWQEQLMADLSEHTGVDLNSKKQFILLFKATSDRYATEEIQREQDEIAKLKAAGAKELKETLSKLKDAIAGRPKDDQIGDPFPPRNPRAEILGFKVTFSMDQLVQALQDDSRDRSYKLGLHACCELIRARDLGGDVAAAQLQVSVRRSVSAAINYFAAGDTRIDGWYRYLSDSLFLCSFCRLANFCLNRKSKDSPKFSLI